MDKNLHVVTGGSQTNQLHLADAEKYLVLQLTGIRCTEVLAAF